MTTNLDQTRENIVNKLIGRWHSSLKDVVTSFYTNLYGGYTSTVAKKASEEMTSFWGDMDYALQSYGEEVRQEVIEELRPILIKAFELSEHAVVEREGNAFVVSTDYKAMVNKALSQLRSTQPKDKP